MEPTGTTDAGTLRGYLDRFLPASLHGADDRMDTLVRYLVSVLEANQNVNLTRITEPREAVIKHLVDSLLPIHTVVGAPGAAAPSSFEGTILDVGTGPGFPGVPLALWLPGATVHLVESIQKKARVVQGAVDSIGLTNVVVHAARAEAVLAETAVDVVVARAVGNTRKLLRLLRPVRDRFRRLVLYKGPEAESELDEARRDADRMGLAGAMHEYGLPDDLGRRSVIQYAAAGAADR